jgi:hypothetical protein
MTFFFGDPSQNWGRTHEVSALAKLREGDMIIAYQTNRQELVDIAQVRQSCQVDGCLYLDPIEAIGVKLAPLKKSDPKIAAIPAFIRGLVKTIYEISIPDAKRLLKAAGSNYPFGTKSVVSTDNDIFKASNIGA